MNGTLDRRVLAFRDDLAALSLKGRVHAPRYAEGRPMRVVAGRAAMRGRPDAAASMVSELVFGEDVTVYDRANGWAWVQAAHDDYVGYVAAADLGVAEDPAPTHRVGVPVSHLYPGGDLKRPPVAMLPLGARFAVREVRGRWLRVVDDLWIPAPHAEPLDALRPDPVDSALALVGVPYLWGGRTPFGLDCSGLVQIVLGLAGIAAPRDSDQQAAALGRALGPDEVATRGDIVFFPGHVGLMADAARLVHANAFAMAVSVEPLEAVVARVAAEIGPDRAPVTARRRL